MPGGLTWSATYDTANRLAVEQLAATGLTNRQFSYQYFSNTTNIGLLKSSIDIKRAVTNTFAYDTFLRVATNSTTGSASDQNMSLSYQYDRRSLLTNLFQVSGSASA